MLKINRNHVTVTTLLFFAIVIGCNSHTKEEPVFEVLDKERTGLDFTNTLSPTPELNMFKYMYFYNGGGVGAGDFNNDGLIDIFFSANQGQNKLYINTGDLRFKDVTKKAKIPQDGGWSTGVSVVDINNDGLLDIYVCKVGHFETLKSKNQFLICEKINEMGIPVYTDKAREYGVDFSGFSTQAAFFDYDMDGDLDMYLLNHSLRYNNTFSQRQKYFGTYDSLSGDLIYRNDGNTFKDATRETGINSSVIGYGLGIGTSDIDLDGYPDIYIGNDFHENDYLYINQRNGTFKDELNDRIMHTSQFSMGVDIADINNDAWPEIISLDMMPADPYILKRSGGEDKYDVFYLKLRHGYNYQYARNNLQLNRGNGMFSEIGMYSGVFATDWSWASLWVDFDNDGLKDLFISNGIPKRMNDMDYIDFVSSEEVQRKIHTNKMEERDMALIDKFPQIKLPDKFFKNNGKAVFKDLENQIKRDRPTYSNGAVYADFDNDGDLDIVVNNIDEPALIYENKMNDKKKKSFLQLKLKGPRRNINAVGSKVAVFADSSIQLYEKYPVRGFQSSMEIPIHIGLDSIKVDSMFLIWPDNTYQAIPFSKENFSMDITYEDSLPIFDYDKITVRAKARTIPIKDITKEVGLYYRHEENEFVEFDREPLIPFMLSTEGPGLAVADINHDGLEDIFIGSSKGKKSAIFLQQPPGVFSKSHEPDLEQDSTYEDVDACWVDVNNDSHVDLVVVSGGNEYYGPEKYLLPRVYLNDGKANFTRLENAFDNLYQTASCVVPYDFNGDGYIDLFIGGRAIPWEYGQIPRSYLLQNDGTGKFKDVTSLYAKDLSFAGFVKQAKWFDMDNDGDQDLILALEWDGIIMFVNEKGVFTKKVLTDKRGWWNFILPYDFDNDGDIDLLAGNLGLNNRLKASEKEPVKFYYGDFDGNGKKEQVLTYFLQGREIPLATKAELEKQLPGLRKQFLYASEFAKASVSEVFTSQKLHKADLFVANYFANSILINEGKFNYTVKPLPWEAQLAPYKDAVIIDVNSDQLPDILLAGNFYENNIQQGRYDADFGTVLLNLGDEGFTCRQLNGLQIKGQVRHIRNIKIANEKALILARNNDSLMVIKIE